MTNLAYINLLRHLLLQNPTVSPRGMQIRELLAFQSIVDMANPMVTLAKRKVSEKFRYGEASWILSGDNRVSSIGPYNGIIAGFSDDGERFFGAYGPKVVDQISYVCQKIVQDQDTRQAVINIWRENPGLTKDVPCTLSLQFLVRGGLVNCVATMRSSDAWLGWVYDVFNFSMVSWLVCLHVRSMTKGAVRLLPGTLILTAGSQHLYERNVEDAKGVLEDGTLVNLKVPLPPFAEFENPDAFIHTLRTLADAAAGR